MVLQFFFIYKVLTTMLYEIIVILYNSSYFESLVKKIITSNLTELLSKSIFLKYIFF